MRRHNVERDTFPLDPAEEYRAKLLKRGPLATVHDVREPITGSTDGPAVLLKIMTVPTIIDGLYTMRNRKSSWMRSVGELVPRATRGGSGQLPGKKPGLDARGERPSDPGAPQYRGHARLSRRGL